MSIYRAQWLWAAGAILLCACAFSGCETEPSPPQVDDWSKVPLSAGHWGGCSSVADGSVRCWGSHPDGADGYASAKYAATATPLAGLAKVTGLAGDSGFGCARNGSGAISCFGRRVRHRLDPDGKLGLQEHSVVEVMTDAGRFGARCGISSAGEVHCWRPYAAYGSGISGLAGNLEAVKSLANVTRLATSSNHACAVTDAGKVACWGIDILGWDGSRSFDPIPVEISGLTGATDVCVGYRTTCAVHDDEGKVSCWGSNDAGQLGSAPLKQQTKPVQVPGVIGAKTVSCTADHSCALLAGGEVWCWGKTRDGILGDGLATEGSYKPVKVAGLAPAIQVAVGWNFACARVKNGGVWCWGASDHGELGHGLTPRAPQPSPAQAKTPTAVAELVGGGTGNCVRTTGSKQWWCWGSGDLVPKSLAHLDGAQSVARGSMHHCHVDAKGGVWCQGRNDRGQLGVDKKTSYVQTPQAVQGLPAMVVVATGREHTCAATAAGKVWCWGSNGHGQLGVEPGSAYDLHTPSEVPSVTGAVALALGSSTSFALTADGTLWGWGMTAGGPPTSWIAAKVTAFPSVVAIAATQQQACLVTTAGEVWCWPGTAAGPGPGVEGPVRVTGLGKAVGVGLGLWHTCVLEAGGKVACWGDNSNGEVGNGSLSSVNTPTYVAGIQGAKVLVSGDTHNCVLQAGDNVKCWGSNTVGQIGHMPPYEASPVRVLGL